MVAILAANVCSTDLQLLIDRRAAAVAASEMTEMSRGEQRFAEVLGGRRR